MWNTKIYMTPGEKNVILQYSMANYICHWGNFAWDFGSGRPSLFYPFYGKPGNFRSTLTSGRGTVYILYNSQTITGSGGSPIKLLEFLSNVN